MDFRDKEGVESAVLKPVVLGSREEAIPHGIPSHGHSCTGVERLKKERKTASDSKHLSVHHGLSHWAGYLGRGHNFCLQKP